MLESDFNTAIRYADLTEKNDNTYSIELAKQFVSICTEFETVARMLCKTIDDSRDAKTITDYKEIILSKHPDTAGSLFRFNPVCLPTYFSSATLLRNPSGVCVRPVQELYGSIEIDY